MSERSEDEDVVGGFVPARVGRYGKTSTGNTAFIHSGARSML